MPQSREFIQLRKTVKWAGLLLTIALFSAWIGSGWGFAGVSGPGFMVYFTGGELQVGWWPPGTLDNGSATSMSWEFNTRRPAEFSNQGLGTVATVDCDLVHVTSHDEGCYLMTLAPVRPSVIATLLSMHVWVLALAVAVPTVLFWRRDLLIRRRLRLESKFCSQCSFDLAGLAADAVCPECGKNRGA